MHPGGLKQTSDDMIPVQVRITKKLLEELDKILEQGIYSSRSEIIRDALRKHINGFGGKDKQSVSG